MASIRERNGSYQIRISCGCRSDGTQVIKSFTWKPDPDMTAKQRKREVMLYADKLEKQYKYGNANGNVKLEAFADRWYAEYVEVKLKKSTQDFYGRYMKGVKEVLGHLSLHKITAIHIQDFLNEMSKRKSKKSDKLLSSTTVRLYYVTLKVILDYAVSLGMIETNPCDKIDSPKREKKEKAIYSIEDMEKLLVLLENEDFEFRMFFALAAFSGFRRGELLGLEWKDIDWDNCIIYVRRAYYYSSSFGHYTDSPKSKTSVRNNKFSPMLFEMLKRYKKYQDEHKAALGDLWQDDDRVFAGPQGGTLSPIRPYQWLMSFLEKNNMQHTTIHSFRHFYASALIHSGVDIVTVSKSLGHASVTTTGNIYCHEFEDARARACDAISAAVKLPTSDLEIVND